MSEYQSGYADGYKMGGRGVVEMLARAWENSDSLEEVGERVRRLLVLMHRPVNKALIAREVSCEQCSS